MLEATLNNGQKIIFPKSKDETIEDFRKELAQTGHRVTELYANDAELWVIFYRFSFNGNFPCTIPIAHTLCTWKDEMARFIVDNL